MSLYRQYTGPRPHQGLIRVKLKDKVGAMASHYCCVWQYINHTASSLGSLIPTIWKELVWSHEVFSAGTPGSWGWEIPLRKVKRSIHFAALGRCKQTAKTWEIGTRDLPAELTVQTMSFCLLIYPKSIWPVYIYTWKRHSFGPKATSTTVTYTCIYGLHSAVDEIVPERSNVGVTWKKNCELKPP